MEIKTKEKFEKQRNYARLDKKHVSVNENDTWQTIIARSAFYIVR